MSFLSNNYYFTNSKATNVKKTDKINKIMNVYCAI